MIRWTSTWDKANTKEQFVITSMVKLLGWVFNVETKKLFKGTSNMIGFHFHPTNKNILYFLCSFYSDIESINVRGKPAIKSSLSIGWGKSSRISCSLSGFCGVQTTCWSPTHCRERNKMLKSFDSELNGWDERNQGCNEYFSNNSWTQNLICTDRQIYTLQ